MNASEDEPPAFSHSSSSPLQLSVPDRLVEPVVVVSPELDEDDEDDELEDEDDEREDELDDDEDADEDDDSSLSVVVVDEVVLAACLGAYSDAGSV
jgi:hypothetical protein